MELQTPPTNLTPLLDTDILRYEIGYGAETGWNAITEGREQIPPFHYVEDLLLKRIESIKTTCNTTIKPRLFMTEGKTFRYDLAKTKPYKGTRVEKKPWHYDNLTVYMRDVLGAEVVTGIEADDRIAIEHVASKETTIVCSRDKDFRQLPGWSYSWELGKQPSFGPICITREGTLKLSADHKKLIATGLVAFYGQVLTGDRVDNIPGLGKCGPVAAFSILSETDNMYAAVREAYSGVHHTDWEPHLLEQGRLCWLTRNLNKDGSPVLWSLGQEE